MTFLRKLLADIATLRRPVTAAAFVATVVALISPFGLDVGPHGPTITGAIVALGAIAAWVEDRYLT